MPIFEYECACGERFEEVVIRRSDEGHVVCPRCHGDQLTRLISRPASAAPGERPSRRGSACPPAG